MVDQFWGIFTSTLHLLSMGWTVSRKEETERGNVISSWYISRLRTLRYLWKESFVFQDRIKYEKTNVNHWEERQREKVQRGRERWYDCFINQKGKEIERSNIIL